jgi:phage tail P2-like protein
MNRTYAITPENLLRTLPEVLRNDEKMLALASSVAKALAARTDEIDALGIYTRVDDLREDLLDILAYDFKVDWYGYDYGLDAKRALIKDSFRVHRRLGTRSAVETALGDLYPESKVEEWFEYGGDPFFFRVVLDVTDAKAPVQASRIERALASYKRLAARMEMLIYQHSATVSIRTGGAAWPAISQSALPKMNWQHPPFAASIHAAGAAWPAIRQIALPQFPKEA